MQDTHNSVNQCALPEKYYAEGHKWVSGMLTNQSKELNSHPITCQVGGSHLLKRKKGKESTCASLALLRYLKLTLYLSENSCCISIANILF